MKHHSEQWLRTIFPLATVVALAWGKDACAAKDDSNIGFLVSDCSADQWGPETKAAYELARQHTSARLISPAAGGGFVDAFGQEVPLKPFRVIWYHQGDSHEQTRPIYDPDTLKALRRHVRAGYGLLLTGAALAMVPKLGAETIEPRRGGPGNDQVTAALVPIVAEHPIFRDLQLYGGVVNLSNAGHPAFADFHGSGGPVGGMLLGGTPGGSENPLVEYEQGKGRILAMGWRLPHYANNTNAYRSNLERLTGNMLAYLDDHRQWKKVVIRPAGHLTRFSSDPGVPDEQWQSLELATGDLIETFGDRYADGQRYLDRLAALKKSHDRLLEKGVNLDTQATAELEKIAVQFEQLRSEALLANPLLDFDRLVFVQRRSDSPSLGLPTNWQGNCSLPKSGFDDAIAILSPVRPDGAPNQLYKPDKAKFVGDLDLHFDADRLLFSSLGSHNRWQIFEIDVDGRHLRQVTRGEENDIDNYDACYLPSGEIIFTSTAAFQGVPCVQGSDHVANLYIMDNQGDNVRQLTFDQDHDWCPTVLSNGRVLYLRWEYSDIPHFASRILFHMNPDGTEQMEYYGSNSYWPNSMFFARPIPAHPSQFVAVISGHHDVPRMGELVLFDSAKGRHEADGVVQRIPGYGKPVEPLLLDGLVKNSWPKILHPWPLSEKYYLVSAKPSAQSNWAIYLVDVFDNLVLLKELPGYALIEPIPLRKTQRPPIVPSRVDSERKDAMVYVADVYSGPGLDGVPRGTVKRLRLFTYHFAYHGMGGQVNRVGLDGPWDIKRVIGTVPVESDGSAMFHIPANTPISVQPLDSEGKALQLMRSWFVGMPGESVSCVGCHERHRTTPANLNTIALTKPVAEITPWYGPTRGFSFEREVQPVLDTHCVGCHDGQTRSDGQVNLDLRPQPYVHPSAHSEAYRLGTKFTPSYLALRRFVRAPTIESDMHMLPPCEFHADTTKLVQLLRKGHYGVHLDAEAWDRLITWIDLHAPAHGTWHEIVGQQRVTHQRDRRRTMMRRYAGLDEDPEAIHEVGYTTATPVIPGNVPLPVEEVNCDDWPLDAAEAKRRQQAVGNWRQTVELGDGVKLELVRIPPGQFVMGDAHGHADEQPLRRMRIERPFWIGQFEITNQQYQLFDSKHDSRLEHGDFLQFSHAGRGYLVNQPRQPVVRVSWNEAMAFCGWLSEQTGRKFTLPTEAQWEYACRAGTNTPLFYGSLDDDFSACANLADANLEKVDSFEPWKLPVGAIHVWRLSDPRFNDRFRVTAPVGSYQPNAWLLHDMHGNAAEWTRDVYESYAERNRRKGNGRKAGRYVVRGGSWYDRPKRSRSAFRLSYWPYQSVYDVGFRVVAEIDADETALRPAVR